MKTALTSFLLLISTLITSAPAKAGSWKHVNLRAATGIHIQLAYQGRTERFDGCYKCDETLFADPLWINVGGPLSKEDRVQVVLLNWQDHRGYMGRELDVQKVDLEFAGNGRFTGRAKPMPIYKTGYGGVYNFEQEVAVVINGQWQPDPVSKSNNFRIKMFQGREPDAR